MKNEKKRDIMLKELVKVIDQVEVCRTILTDKGFSDYPGKEQYYYQQSMSLRDYLINVKEKIQQNNTPISKEDIARFKDQLSKIHFNYTTYKEGQVMQAEQISENQMKYEKMCANLIYCARSILHILDLAFSKFFGRSETYEEKGETPLALRLMGHSQFLPRPITSISESLNRLRNMNERLEEVIGLCDVSL
ncbi:MAG: hypothetical protein ACO1N3_01830 [Gammaproteobacteria bacterium]